MTKFRARGSDGIVAVYDGNDNVFTNPSADYSRVRFHSSLIYPNVVSILTGVDVVIPAGPTTAPQQNTITAIAHGQSGRPLVDAVITGYNGSPVGPYPVLGSFPEGMITVGLARWITVASDDTNILIQVLGSAVEGANWLGSTITFDFYVSDFDMESDVNKDPYPNEALYINATEFRVNKGNFDISKRYWRTEAANPVFAMAGGKTLDIEKQTGTGNKAFAVRYSVGSHTVQRTQNSLLDTSASHTTSFTATTQDVSL